RHARRLPACPCGRHAPRHRDVQRPRGELSPADPRRPPPLMALPESELACYRPGVGIMLLNPARLVFIGRRIDMPAGLAAWQMPQGGIDPGESPPEAAM